MTKKPGHSPNNLKANGTGAFHTNIHGKNVLILKICKHLKTSITLIGPSKNCTDETTSVNKSLNFGDFQAQNQGGNGIRQKVTVKSEMKEPRSVQIPGNRLTNHNVKPSKSCTEERSQRKAY